MKRFRQFSIVALLLVSFAAGADFQAGMVALARRDYAEAMNIFKPLAANGNAAAQINLGNLYMKGLGVEQNYRTALHWYRSAAEQGERLAQTKLGILYFHGLGTAKDQAEATRWFQKAAEQGEASAQSILASLYAFGDGVPQDYAQAYYWYTMAEEQGDQEAARGRKSLEEDMTPGQKDEALRLLSEAKKLRIEQEEKAFEAATAGLGPPPVPPADESAVEATQPAKSGRHGKPKAQKKTRGRP